MNKYFGKLCTFCGGSGVVDPVEPHWVSTPCGECEQDGISYGAMLTDEGRELLEALKRINRAYKKAKEDL